MHENARKFVKFKVSFRALSALVRATDGGMLYQNKLNTDNHHLVA